MSCTHRKNFANEETNFRSFMTLNTNFWQYLKAALKTAHACGSRPFSVRQKDTLFLITVIESDLSL